MVQADTSRFEAAQAGNYLVWLLTGLLKKYASHTQAFELPATILCRFGPHADVAEQHASCTM